MILVGAFGVVVDELGVKVGLHPLDGLLLRLATLDAEMLVQKGAMPAPDKAVAPWPVDLRGAVLHLLEL